MREPTRVERTANAIRENYRDCPACGGTGEIRPGSGCAICCTTGILPKGIVEAATRPT